MENKTKKRSAAHEAALLAVLTALALVLGYLESLIPVFAAIPGIKIGLPNLVVIAALYLMDVKSAIIVNAIRIVLSGILFGNGLSIVYSLCGGALSLAVMILLKKTGRLHIVVVSIAGGVFHNVGQIAAAAVLMQTKAIVWYLPVLWIGGIISGAAIGAVSGLITGRLVKAKIFTA